MSLAVAPHGYYLWILLAKDPAAPAIADRRRHPPHRGPEAPEYGMDTPISQRPVVRPVCKAGRTQVVWKPELLLSGFEPGSPPERR